MQPRVLAYDIAGVGEPVVLLPGGLTGWLSWIPHQQALAGRWRMIRVQPIHNELGSAGQTEDPTYGIDVAVESLRMTLDHLDLSRPHFGGWSAGGHLLLEFTRRYPDRVRSMTLIEPAGRWIVEQVGGAHLDVGSINELLDRMAGSEVSDDHFALFLAHSGFVPDPAQARSHPYWEIGYPHRQTLSWMSHRYFNTDATLDDLREMSAPTLAVKGNTTEEWEKLVIDTLGEMMPNARVLELEGGHACHIEDIDTFLPEFEAHLQAS